MDKEINSDDLSKEVLIEQIRKYYLTEINAGRSPAVHKIATIFNLTWPRTERLLKKIDPEYKMRKKKLEEEKEINLQRAVRSYYISELEKGNILSIEEIAERFSISWMRAKGYLKKIATKAYGRHIRNQQKTKEEARKMFLSGASKNEIYEKYQNFNQRTIDAWLTGLVQKRIEDQKAERNKQICEYYLEKIKTGSPPTDMEMMEKFHIRHWALNECLKDVKVYAPENGIYELKINGLKVIYLSYETIAGLLNRSVARLQSILKDKIPERIFLFDKKGRKKFFYPINKVFEIYPKLKRIFDQIHEFAKINIRYKIPAEINEIEFLVLYAIVSFQETYKRKPTKKQINIILKYYKFTNYCIEKIIKTLKQKGCIIEDEYYFIKRGPLNVVATKGRCYNKLINVYETRYYPRMFTSPNWEIMGYDKIVDRSNIDEKTSEEKMLDLIRQIRNSNNKAY